jgi:hypothetical protein
MSDLFANMILLAFPGSHVQGGIVMVDDYFAEGWPGVSEGVHAFMLHQRASDASQAVSATPQIMPFFVGFNKVLFAAEEFAGSYQDALMSGQNLIGILSEFRCAYTKTHILTLARNAITKHDYCGR